MKPPSAGGGIKKRLIYFVAAFCCFGLYLLTSFWMWSLNPADWSEFARFLLAFSYVCVAAAAPILASDLQM